MPGTLLAGILLGIATPTEIAGLAVVYGVVLAMLVYREMNVAGFLRAVEDTAGADRRAAVHLRRRLELFLDPDGRLSAAAAGRSPC